MDNQNTQPLQIGAPIPTGATIGNTQTPSAPSLQVGSPIPQGATIGTPPETGLQSFVNKMETPVEGEPSWESSSIGRVIGGGTKEGANALGNILDLISNPKAGGPLNPEAIDAKLVASTYKKLHPEATPQQISDFTNRIIRQPNQPRQVREAIDWLHSAGQPEGFWEHVGSMGEQALEWFGADGLTKLASAPALAGEATEAAVDTAGHLAQAQNISKVLQANPKLAGIVTVGLKAIQDALGTKTAGVVGDIAARATEGAALTGAQNYAHTEDTKSALESAALGGGISGAVEGGIAQPLKSLAGAAEEVAPKAVNIAGQDIPVAATHPDVNVPELSATGQRLAGAATKQGAEEFVASQVQPAARKALQNNFATTATDSVNALKTIRGEDPYEEGQPVLNTLTGTAKFMRDEAKKTYQTLDDVAQKDIDEWTAKYGKQVQKTEAKEGTKLVDQYGKPIQSEGAETPLPEIPPKPKLFTELQDQLQDAQDTIKSRVSSQVDKQTAIEALPKYKQEMQDFLAQHKDLVDSKELDTANSVYSESKRYDWLAKKLRSATSGAGQGGVFKGDTLRVRPQALENLERQYDNQFGEGSFRKLLGNKAYTNFNDVVNTLKTPVTGDKLADWLNNTPLHAGKLFTIPVGAFADKLLFDPTFASQVIDKFQGAAETAGKAGIRAGQAAGTQVRPKAYNAAATALGGSNPNNESSGSSGSSLLEGAGASTAPGKLAINLATELPNEVGKLVDKYARKYSLPINLARAVVFHESRGNPNAVGKTTSKGEQAKGLGQLLPHTAQEMGVLNPFDPEQNLNGSMKYLSQLYKQHGDDPLLAYAAYTSGPNRIKQGDNIQDVINKLPHEGKVGVNAVAKLLGIDLNAKQLRKKSGVTGSW